MKDLVIVFDCKNIRNSKVYYKDKMIEKYQSLSFTINEHYNECEVVAASDDGIDFHGTTIKGPCVVSFINISKLKKA